MQDEFLTRCVVDPVGPAPSVCISSEGDERIVDCETVDQFMSVLELGAVITCDEDVVAYAKILSEGKMNF